MKTAADLLTKLNELEADTRLTQQRSAQVFSNAPLALIQMGGRAQIDTLRWALDLPPYQYPKDK